ncbi:MAG: choice-of-anchor J domain-containing protein [bacterium]
MKQILIACCSFLFIVPGTHAGTLDAVYLQEGFNGASIPPGWTQLRLSGTQAAWSVVGQGSNPTVAPYAGTGQAKFNSFTATSGEQARLISPPINISSSTDPFLSFFMYHEDEYLSTFDSVYIEASTIDSVNGPWTTLAGLQRPRTQNTWKKEVVSLYQYRTASRLFLSLRGVSKFGNNVFLDEFRVADSTFHDIGPIGFAYNAPVAETVAGSPTETASRFSTSKENSPSIVTPGPVRILASAPLNIGVIMRNFGTFTENSYTIAWRIDQQQQTPVNGRPINARTGQDTITLSWQTPTAGAHTITAWSVLSSDSNRTNDTTRLTIQVLDTSTVFYESFNGTTFPPANWITINRDGGTLGPWFRGSDTSAFVSFEGSGFAANNFQRANGFYLDDYLITPAIAGVGQTGRLDSLIFRVRSKSNTAPSPNFPDSLMVRLSTTGTDTSNFTILLDYFSVPKTGWTRKAYSLTGRVPSNSTIRIAFRYLLYNSGLNGNNGDFIGLDAVQVIFNGLTAVDERTSSPMNFALGQNYPNPFNPSTEIRYQTSEAGHVTLRMFDLLGREVATLVNEQKPAGNYSARVNAADLASGIYFYRMDAGAFSQTKKMILMK